MQEGSHLLGHGADDVRVTRVGDGHDGHTEVLSAASAKVDVAANIGVDTSLGEHGVVLDLGLAEGSAVVGDDDELSLATADGLKGLLVAEDVLATLHDEGEARVDGLSGLLLQEPEKRWCKTNERTRRAQGKATREKSCKPRHVFNSYCCNEDEPVS
eukprot:TRINITY_DN718_c0_g1_i2.p1 TRINITY_DN718_c0_g1~~TRINITY_DN718_c0_g1_i2.p1  ORF type:complete len:157 (-),score=10.34 TRINITY_DN718_c0_g1_i2:69-539(-)